MLAATGAFEIMEKTLKFSTVLPTLSPYTHTHTRLTAFLLGLPGRASTRKVKPIWILLKQETVSGSVSIPCDIFHNTKQTYNTKPTFSHVVWHLAWKNGTIYCHCLLQSLCWIGNGSILMQQVWQNGQALINWNTKICLNGYTILVCDQPTRSSQACIPPGSLNRVPASVGVKSGMTPLLGGR